MATNISQNITNNASHTFLLKTFLPNNSEIILSHLHRRQSGLPSRKAIIQKQNKQTKSLTQTAFQAVLSHWHRAKALLISPLTSGEDCVRQDPWLTAMDHALLILSAHRVWHFSHQCVNCRKEGVCNCVETGYSYSWAGFSNLLTKQPVPSHTSYNEWA